MLRDGIKTLAKQAYVPKNCRLRHRSVRDETYAGCYTQAKPHTISSYRRLVTTDEMLACLASGYPFVFGFRVCENFESATVARSGVVNLPKKGERTIGGHTMCAIGYDDKKQHFIMRNSWGAALGQKG